MINQLTSGWCMSEVQRGNLILTILSRKSGFSSIQVTGLMTLWKCCKELKYQLIFMKLFKDERYIETLIAVNSWYLFVFTNTKLTKYNLSPSIWDIMSVVYPFSCFLWICISNWRLSDLTITIVIFVCMHMKKPLLFVKWSIGGQ